MFYMKKLRSRKFLIITGIILGIIALIISLFFVFMPHMKIVGKEKMTIKLNALYKEKGVTYKNLFGKKGNKVKIKGKIDNKKIGTYKIEYSSNYLFFKIKRVRKLPLSMILIQ